ncbi:MAG: hypothetical protein KDA84_02685 [Planctomycetaceae bacterium]|nr:hypothetical protein [Planctomycetaceae bacterium]
MTETNSKMFANCVVRFALDSDESFSIVPYQYLDFGNDNLIMAVFELVSRDLSRKAYDCIYEDAFVALRDFLANAETAKIGHYLEFNSEEEIVVTTFTRQESTIRVSGRVPNDGYLEAMYKDSQSILERQFHTQAVFYCNFPLKNIPVVVDDMTRIIQVIEDSK